MSRAQTLLMLLAVLIVVPAVGCRSTTAEVDARRSFVLAHIDTAILNLSYRTAEQDPRRPAVRDSSVMFYVSPFLRVVSLETYPDGQPTSSARRVDASAMRAMVDILRSRGFFTEAASTHSEWVLDPKTPPPAGSLLASDASPAAYPSGALEVQLTVSAGEWHRTLSQGYPLDQSTRNMLLHMCRAVPPEACADLEAGLLGKMR